MKIKKEMLSFCLLTDTHYTENGLWKDTAENITKTLNNNEVDAIVHLGDFTDGTESREVTSQYVSTILSDLKENGVPLYVTAGNHDYNFFRGNSERFSKKEMLQCLQLEKEYYYQDFDEYKIRCLFLYSYDADTPIRYGFPDEEISWVEKSLNEAPQGYKILVFSHAAPLYFLDYWSRIIWNGEKLVGILEDYNARSDRQILAYIHGHTHAEYIYRGSSFPIISIGCNKCEQLLDKIPAGSYAYERDAGTETQDLWDILQIDSENERLHFIRFGAGKDRIVDCRKSESTWRQAEAEKKAARTTKIWAHRGSSGFAPENTLPSFEIAKALNVDGITLDVQMTKEGELVVIHDETIDRTSDGTGMVKDYTLAQLRQFNFAVNKPGFGFVTIPTLREVFGMFRGTDFTICVGTGNGIKERVHELTAEMGMEQQVVYTDSLDENGLQVVWAVNEEEQALMLRDMGVDAIVTNHPGKMRDIIRD